MKNERTARPPFPFWLLFAALPLLLKSQTPPPEFAPPSDSAQAQQLMDAGKKLQTNAPDSALLLFQKALVFAQKAGNERMLAKIQINAAAAALNKGRFHEGLAFCEKSIPICKKLGMMKELCAAHNNMANAWNFIGDHQKAAENYLLALEAAEKAEVPAHFPISIRGNLAILYNDLNEFEKGLEQSLRCYADALKIDDETTVAVVSQTVANAYLGLKNEQKALEFFRISADLARKVEHTQLLATDLGNIAKLIYNQNRVAEAKLLYKEALKLSEGIGDDYSLMLNNHGLAEIAFFKRDFSEAKSLAVKALQHSQKLDSKEYVYVIWLMLSDIALVEGDMKRWTECRDKYLSIRDSLSGEALVRATEEMETKYETRQKEEKIQHLQLEQENQQLKIREKNGLLWGLGSLAFLALLAAALGFRNFRQKQRLAEQSAQLQEQKIRELEQEKQLSAVDAMLRGQEEERARLARDLHDGLGGMLSGVRQTLNAAKLRAGDLASAAEPISSAIARLDDSIQEMRTVARNLMPEALLRFGMKDALEDFCGFLTKNQTLKIHFQTIGLENRLPNHLEVMIFRIVQELLNNTVRHAAATEAIVQIIRDGQRLHLTVEDNGKGFDPKTVQNAAGIGWLNIRSRADYLKGKLDVRSAPGKGASVEIEFEIQ